MLQTEPVSKIELEIQLLNRRMQDGTFHSVEIQISALTSLIQLSGIWCVSDFSVPFSGKELKASATYLLTEGNSS